MLCNLLNFPPSSTKLPAVWKTGKIREFFDNQEISGKVRNSYKKWGNEICLAFSKSECNLKGKKLKFYSDVREGQGIRNFSSQKKARIVGEFQDI